MTTDVPRTTPDAAGSSADPIRVLLWSRKGSGLHYGGPGSFSYRLYSKAPPGRFRITLAHAFPDQAPVDLYEAEHFVTAPPRTGNPALTLMDLRRYCREARAWLREHARDHDVLHGLGGFHATMRPAWDAQMLGLPSVVFLTVANSDLADKGRLHRIIGLARRRRRMAGEISGLVAMSREILAELHAYGIPDERIARIPMGVDVDRFRPPADDAERRANRAELGWPERPTMIFCGVLVARKRPHLCVEAIAELAERGLDAQVVLVGPSGKEADYARSVIERAKDLGVADRVIEYGFTDDPAPLLRAADVFCLPSRSEGMSAAMVEAAASGCPPIMTPVSGVADVIDDGVDGHVVEPIAASIADAFALHIEDPATRRAFADAGRRKVVERFSLESVGARYERLFRLVMAGGRPADA